MKKSLHRKIVKNHISNSESPHLEKAHKSQLQIFTIFSIRRQTALCVSVSVYTTVENKRDSLTAVEDTVTPQHKHFYLELRFIGYFKCWTHLLLLN